jgi:methionyl-tRNA formyltransferase
MKAEAMAVGFFGDIPLIANRISSLDGMNLEVVITRSPSEFNLVRSEVIALEEPYHDTVTSVLSDNDFEVLVTAGFPVILEQSEINETDIAVNVHKGLLPRNRGRHPIATAFDEDWDTTGVTIHELAPEIDAGGILAQQRVQLGLADNHKSMQFKTDIVAGDLLEEVCREYLATGTLRPKAQNEELATYYRPRTPSDSEIDWAEDSTQICKLVSVSKDDYAAFTLHDGEKVLIHSCNVFDGYGNSATTNSEPGTVIESGSGSLLITTGSGCVVVSRYSTESSEPIDSGSLLA